MAITKKTHRAGVYADFFCDGVQRGSVLTLAGQIGVDQNGKIAPDMKSQVVVCYENIQRVLSEFGKRALHHKKAIHHAYLGLQCARRMESPNVQK